MKNISIIVVSLNTKKDFIKTIKSIKDQNYEDAEIIVIDGQSTDGTVEEINKMKKYFSKIIIEKDSGIYYAMNKGILLADSKWIIFMNSGDVFFNSKILNSIDFLSISDKDILYGDTIIDMGNFKYRLEAKDIIKNHILMPFSHQSCFVKTSLQKRNLFFCQYKFSSDFNFFIKCMKEKKIFYNLKKNISINKVNGISDLNRIEVIEENIKILNLNNLILASKKLSKIKFLNHLKIFLKKFINKKVLNILLRIKYSNKIINL